MPRLADKPRALQLEMASCTDMGRVREHNEDAIACDAVAGIAVLAYEDRAEAVMEREAQRIEAALPPSCRLIALDEHGQRHTTASLAAEFQRWRQDGRDVALLIGGADGLAPRIKQRADSLLRLSDLTLPHGLARVLLAEQIYRAHSLLSGHPYHRA